MDTIKADLKALQQEQVSALLQRVVGGALLSLPDHLPDDQLMQISKSDLDNARQLLDAHLVDTP